MRGHKIYSVRRCHLRWDNKIAFILALFIVNQDEHSPVACFFDDFLNPDNHRGIVIVDEKSLQFVERIGGSLPHWLGAITNYLLRYSGGACRRSHGDSAASNHVLNSLRDIGTHSNTPRSFCDHSNLPRRRVSDGGW